MAKKILGYFGTPIYLYVLTVVTYYGYNSNFGIPSNYLEFSVVTPIIFFFDISRGILEFCKTLNAWAWIGILVATISFLIVLSLHSAIRWIALVVFVIFLVRLPFGFYGFGEFIAKSTTSYYTLPSDCIPGATEKTYIAPTLFGGKAIFVPIDTDTKKIKNGLLVREVTDLTCQLEKREIGKISR